MRRWVVSARPQSTALPGARSCAPLPFLQMASLLHRDRCPGQRHSARSVGLTLPQALQRVSSEGRAMARALCCCRLWTQPLPATRLRPEPEAAPPAQALPPPPLRPSVAPTLASLAQPAARFSLQRPSSLP
ncbi:unnamed protein product [Rangifer tarandus platyrhynchus]|uniref:Uncharacterized protein n=2 Tax=Rangifer tarandus platyrhynchus TaxID=3082113 RepID=A0ABN8YAD1_RANTA|nr:unnamed protein product [Rangifer tarandus platyrhynchus]